MDFTSISDINRYMKTINMKHIWKQNADNPFKSVIPGSPDKTSGEAKQSAGALGDDRFMNIKAKIQSGQKLSASDLDYLRENYPDEYDNVIKLEKEKKEYEEELSRCKTKDDARMLHMGKVAAALSALKSGAVSAEVILAKLAKMAEAYEEFTESAHYSKLAENHSELAKAIEAEKDAVSGEKEFAAAEQENDRNKAPDEKDNHEPQDPPVQPSEAPHPVDKETPVPEFDSDYKPKHVEPGNPVSAPKVGIDKIPTDVKPSFTSNRAVKTVSEASVTEAETVFSHNRLNRHA